MIDKPLWSQLHEELKDMPLMNALEMEQLHRTFYEINERRFSEGLETFPIAFVAGPNTDYKWRIIVTNVFDRADGLCLALAA